MSTGPRSVRVVVPQGIDDPTMPSGGNVYDRRLCEELTRSGWAVEELAVADSPAGALADVLGRVPDGSMTLVDGLVAVAEPITMLRESTRLRFVVLLHQPFGERDAATRASERRVLSAATAVVTTSEWTRRWVLRTYGLRPWSVCVAQPGVDPAGISAGISAGSETGERLLCVAAVTRDKGHDLLLSALARITDLPWQLTCAGSLSRDRQVAEARQRAAVDLGLADRVAWTGALSRPELDKLYAEADALVLASRAESWGMVVTESLARAVPVVAGEVGGLPEALGSSPSGRPGLLVPPGDVSAMAAALRRWLGEPGLRSELRARARARRTTLSGWPVTAAKVAAVLEDLDR